MPVTKYLNLFLIVMILALIGVITVGCGGPETATFPDKNLEIAVKKALGKSEED